MVLYEPPGSCARGSSTPFPGRPGQAHPRHARRQPHFLPARRSGRHGFLGAWRDPLPSCTGALPPRPGTGVLPRTGRAPQLRAVFPQLPRKGTPPAGRVSLTAYRGVPTAGRGPQLGLQRSRPVVRKPRKKQRRVPTSGPGILTGTHRGPDPACRATLTAHAVFPTTGLCALSRTVRDLHLRAEHP